MYKTKVKSNNTSGIGFIGMLQILFIALKLLGKIDWNWFWVLSPTLISLGLLVTIILIVTIINTKG